MKRQAAKRRDKDTIDAMHTEIGHLRSEVQAWRNWWYWWDGTHHHDTKIEAVISHLEPNESIVSICKPIDYSRWDHLDELLDSDEEIRLENESIYSDPEKESEEDYDAGEEAEIEGIEEPGEEAEDDEEEAEYLGYEEYDDDELDHLEEQKAEPPDSDEEATQTALKSTLLLQFEEAGASIAGSFERALLTIPKTSGSAEALLSLQRTVSQQQRTYVTMLLETKLAEFDAVRAHQLADMIEAWRTNIVKQLNEVLSMDPG